MPNPAAGFYPLGHPALYAPDYCWHNGHYVYVSKRLKTLKYAFNNRQKNGTIPYLQHAIISEWFELKD
jgi:hypothetical protein